jgi:hypothetical protein
MQHLLGQRACWRSMLTTRLPADVACLGGARAWLPAEQTVAGWPAQEVGDIYIRTAHLPGNKCVNATLDGGTVC